jgi:hypothetical protein
MAQIWQIGIYELDGIAHNNEFENANDFAFQ